MSGFVRICSQAELPPAGEVREVMAEGRTFCVANIDGAIAVLDGICPHRGGPLGQGIVEEGRVVCPWHAWAFDVHTGAALHNPNAKAQVIDAVVEDGELRVKI